MISLGYGSGVPETRPCALGTVSSPLPNWAVPCCSTTATAESPCRPLLLRSSSGPTKESLLRIRLALSALRATLPPTVPSGNSDLNIESLVKLDKQLQDALTEMMKKVSGSAGVAPHNIDSVAELRYVSMESKIHLRKGKYRRYSEEKSIIESENKPE